MKENNQSKLPESLLESLSALSDCEATESDLLSVFKDEENFESIRDEWASYQAIGNMLRKETSEGVDISAVVSTAIESESQLSALTDGELTELELRRILKDEESFESMRDEWSGYQSIGSMLRREPSKGVDISVAVSEAIESESQSKTKSQPNRFFKPLGQFAVAASVAAVALFGVQQYQLSQVEGVSTGDTVAEIEALTPTESNEFTPPAGFEVRPQTSVVSANPGASNIADDELQLQIHFDEEALYEHVNESILEHNRGAAEATQDISPILRAPTEN